MKEGQEVAEYIRSYFGEHKEFPATRIVFYRIGRLLGMGAFGKVNLGMHKLTGKLVAIKSIKKEYLSDEASKQKVLQEYSILKHLRHPNVIRLHESFETDKHILIVTEMCSGGDLLNYVKQRKKLPEDTAKLVFKQLIKGLQYCHAQGVVHRDIKLDNILLNSSGELKICDFGVSRLVRRGERIKGHCGTPAYIAPEILRGKGYEGFGVDVWSAGVALYAILYGTVPFKSNNIRGLQKLIKKGRYVLKEEVSWEARDLLGRLLERHPSRRINIEDILKHKWMQGVNESISLFSEEEQKKFDLCYFHVKENVKLGQQSISLFTEQNIDSTQNGLMRNNTSRSLILAPFNTTRSDKAAPCLDPSLAARPKNEVVSFNPKVRDADRQYEKNNNLDVDNGVYNEFVCNSEDKNESLEGSSSGDLSDSEEKEVEKEELADVKEKKGAIDESALAEMKRFGYTAEYVRSCLNSNELNHATATYYLMTNHYQ
eukprot:TRINITY_DN301_c0_g4_i1.p1 TRINITY_DN301_c0_g4~~TRINITY_DN301_c0_g4_i1.p1  ORF type:complete len:485 (-),score=132.32 TRINITY_DN301_c0_g4_i1:42-1496(-)